MEGTTVNRQLLTKEFDPSEIKTRPVGGGGNASYLAVDSVIRRLNEAAPEWSFEVRKEWREDRVTKALVRLTIPGMGSREHIGMMELDGNLGADAVAKGAISDGLKKAATLFGVGLHLVEGDDYGHAPAPQQYQQQAPQQQQGYQQQYQQAPPQQQQYQQKETGELASEKQRKMIYAITNKMGISLADVARITNTPISGGIDDVTKAQARPICDWLVANQDNPNALQQAQPQQQQQQYQQPQYGGGYGGATMDDAPF